MSDTEVYCPDCEVELMEDEYSLDEGCQLCGTTDLWISPKVFREIVKSGLQKNVQERLKEAVKEHERE